MKKEVKFYICKHCGNLVTFINESGAPLTCCNDQMVRLVPNTTDAATEKHVPVIEKVDNGVKVSVGSVAHPMAEEHYIQWIALETENEVSVHYLNPGEKPETIFLHTDLEVCTVYEYCNLHGLWKANL